MPVAGRKSPERSSRPRIAAASLAWVLAVAGIALASGARAITVDQDNLGVVTLGISYKFFSLAQSFTPAGSPLTEVELKISCCSDGDPGPATLRVDIRQGGIVGPVIGSAELILPHGSSSVPLKSFAFSPPVPLTLGALYVIELVHVAGGNGFLSGTVADSYPGGTRFTDGVAAGGDLMFRTGVAGQTDAGAGLPVEYSNAPDERALGGVHDGLDPAQVLFTLAPDAAADAFPNDGPDYLPLLEAGDAATEQVDALANGRDFLFDDVAANAADLLISLQGDAGAAEIAAFVEDPLGATAVDLTHLDLNANDTPGDLDEVDALELWGPVTAGDAVLFSRASDASTGISVFRFDAGAAAAYVFHSQIVAAVQALGFVGDPNSVDLDALMLKNLGLATAFDSGDQILFSIRAAGNFDGGEIIHLAVGSPPAFLQHGLHAWDTAFDVSAALGAAAEEVDALEAGIASVAVPVPALDATGVALLACALALVGGSALVTSSRLRGARKLSSPS